MNHPHITTLVGLYRSETQPFRKVHRMVDLFESLIKMHTVVILAEYVRHNCLSDAAKGLLSQGLRTPSLGTWQLFSRVLFDELESQDCSWIVPSFRQGFEELTMGLQHKETDVIAFRNLLVHGATPGDAVCEADILRLDPFLEKLLQSQWLLDTAIEICDGKVMLKASGGERSLHPMLLHRHETDGPSLSFFNDLKNEKVGLLNYPLSKYYREKEFYTEFLEHLPIQEWRKGGNDEFHRRVEELTETFKGRIRERASLMAFAQRKNKGYLSVQGNPGIGKSALLAQFVKDIRTDEGNRNIQVVEYFIRRGTLQSRVDYFFQYLIRRTDRLFPDGRKISAEEEFTYRLQSQLYEKWRLWGEHSGGKKILFIIDGLDEGTENSLVHELPRENFKDILFIYGSRPGGHASIDELWGELPAEDHVRIELSGLEIEDVRALIYEVSNKYELERDSPWIEKVLQRSQGNPLYLKLLCDALENGSIRLNDSRALPEKIDDYYRAILHRYAHDPDGDGLLSCLYTFAAARGYLTMGHLELVNGLGPAALYRIGSTLKEVLMENPNTEDVLDYQLFHESFREYLARENPRELVEANQRIISFCAGWKSLTGRREQYYALEHYASHLSDSELAEHWEFLLRLIHDAEYATAQKTVLKQFEPIRRMYRHALSKAVALGRDDEMMEVALGLVDLWHEESNDASYIVSLFLEGDIELALARIDRFGGTDKVGLQRKCTLYLLCLLEMTLLSGREKPFRNKAIEKLLNHFDQKIPIDHSILAWHELFPMSLAVKMAIQWENIGVDYRTLFMRAGNIDAECFYQYEQYHDFVFNLLIDTALHLESQIDKDFALESICHVMLEQNKLPHAKVCIGHMSPVLDKSSLINRISHDLASKGEKSELRLLMIEYIECLRLMKDEGYKSLELSNLMSIVGDHLTDQVLLEYIPEIFRIADRITDDYWKCHIMAAISTCFFRLDKSVECEKSMLEAMAAAKRIENQTRRDYAFKSIAMELAITGKTVEVLCILLAISDDDVKSDLVVNISIELAKVGKVNECFEYVSYIDDEESKSSLLGSIAFELAMNGNVEHSIYCTTMMSQDASKSRVLGRISTVLASIGEIDKAASIIQEAISICMDMTNGFEKFHLIKSLIEELSLQRNLASALSILQELKLFADELPADKQMADYFIEISREIEKLGEVHEAISLMEEAFKISYIITDAQDRNDILKKISDELYRIGYKEKALSVMQDSISYILELKDLSLKCSLLCEKVCDLYTVGEEHAATVLIEEAVACAAKSTYGDDISESPRKGVIEMLVKVGNIDKVSFLMKESLYLHRGIQQETKKEGYLSQISSELTKRGRLPEATACLHAIISEEERDAVLMELSKGLAGTHQFEEALSFSENITSHRCKISTLMTISSHLSSIGRVDESASLINDATMLAYSLSEDAETCKALLESSDYLYRKGMTDESKSLLNQAILIARVIEFDMEKCHVLAEISSLLHVMGNTDLSSSLMQEAISIAVSIRKILHHSHGLKNISIELTKQGRVEDALKYAEMINDIGVRSTALQSISSEVAKQGKLVFAEDLTLKALACAQSIKDEKARNVYLHLISKDLILQGKIDEAEKHGSILRHGALRHENWKEMAENVMDSRGWHHALEVSKRLQCEEARSFFLRGWSEKLPINEADMNCFTKALPTLAFDGVSLEELLQKFALREIFFGRLFQYQHARLDRSLNIQWALDISNTFPQPERNMPRLFKNLQEWLHEISDEDDREQVLLWAKQVSKGKMTDIDFQWRVQGL